MSKLNFLCHLLLAKTESDKIKKSVAKVSLVTKNLQTSKAEILKWTREISALRRIFVSIKDSKQQAGFEYMSMSEKNLCRNFQDIKFLSTLPKSVYNLKKIFEKISEEVHQKLKFTLQL